MKTNYKTHSDTQCSTNRIAIIAFLIWAMGPNLMADGPCGSCGHPTGYNYITYNCDIVIPRDSYCLIEYLPPGYYSTQWGSCEYTCVDIYSCEPTTYSGPTTSRFGECQPDESCLIDQPPFQDNMGTADVDLVGDSCLGS
jgi:hypothetical protein